jgi:hypothetical protein
MRACHGTCFSTSDPIFGSDDQACGASGGACVTGNTCQNGSCTPLGIVGVLASSYTTVKPTGPNIIAAGHNLYWGGWYGISGGCNPGGGGCAIGGPLGAFSCVSEKITVVASTGGNSAYYVIASGTGISHPEIMEEMNACSTQVAAGDTVTINGMTMDPGGDLFWTDASGQVQELVGGAGTPQTIIAAGSTTPINAAGLVVVGTTVYYAAQGAGATTGEIRAVPIGGGGSFTQLATNQALPQAVVVVGSNVYWIDSGDGTVWSNSITGGPGTAMMIASGQNQPMYLTADASALFWTNAGDNSLVKLPFCASAPIVLATGRNQIGGVALVNNHVYWTEVGANNIFQAAE